jgi:hypothetical protein
MRWWIVGMTTLGVGLLLFGFVRVQGEVEGEEFSASHFQLRSFRFIEIPYLHLQVSPIRRKSIRCETATYLKQKGLISIPSEEPRQWDLITISRGIGDAQPADALFLTESLQLKSHGNLWETWSESHPKLAKILWPAVQKLAQRELYILIPRLLDTAYNLDESQDLQSWIDSYLQKEYVLLARQIYDAGRVEVAQELVAEAISDYPNHRELLSLARQFQDSP